MTTPAILSSASPLPKTRPLFHRPELDLLRFTAFLMVFVHHGLAFTHPFRDSVWNSEEVQLLRSVTGYGLCLFFVLSSYLITEILLRERQSTGTIHLRAFYIRRVLRIWPLYACFLPVGYLFGRLFSDYAIHKSFVFQYIFLLGNYAFYHHVTANPIGPLWSISIEEQFYLCWPFVALRFGGRGLYILSLLTIAASVASSSWLTAHALHPGLAIWTDSIAEFGCFAAGALLALGLHRKEWKPSSISRVWLFLAGLMSWLVSDGVFHFKRDEMIVDRSQLAHVLGFQLVIVGCVFLFLAVLSLPLGRWAEPFIYLGRVSYGLYVFHILAIISAKSLMTQSTAGTPFEYTHRWAALVLAFVFSCLCAAASYECFERPILRLKARFAFVRT